MYFLFSSTNCCGGNNIAFKSKLLLFTLYTTELQLLPYIIFSEYVCATCFCTISWVCSRQPDQMAGRFKQQPLMHWRLLQAWKFQSHSQLLIVVKDPTIQHDFFSSPLHSVLPQVLKYTWRASYGPSAEEWIYCCSKLDTFDLYNTGKTLYATGK